MSWKVDVIADDSGQWAGNTLRFTTRIEAENYAIDLGRRWRAIKFARAIECADPANYSYISRELKAVA